MPFQTTYQSCGSLCTETPCCTHYTWAKGSCTLKKGQVGLADAYSNGDYETYCGYLKNSKVFTSLVNTILSKCIQIFKLGKVGDNFSALVPREAKCNINQNKLFIVLISFNLFF